jgi:hypothetical protein
MSSLRRRGRTGAWTNRPGPYPACWQWPALDIAGRIIGESCDAASNRHVRAIYYWQAGRCAICGIQQDPGRSGHGLVLDHDHGTNLTRGLLCNRCNMEEGRSKREIFRAYRHRYPALILGVTVPHNAVCIDASCDCLGLARERWLTEVVESGITDVAQLGTLMDVLERGTTRYSTCASLGGHQCCEHGPQTLPPRGRLRCTACRGWGWDSSGTSECAQCLGEGHLPPAPKYALGRLEAAARSLLATQPCVTPLTDEQAGAANHAAILLERAAAVLRTAELLP